MRIDEIRIDRYGPLRGFTHECQENLEVIYGPNESGKTLLLESMLKLLAPDIEAVFPGITRVNEYPSGYLYLDTVDGEVQLGDGQHLEDISTVTPHQLRNIFVVRDSDLELRDEHSFYDSVTQRIGDLHTDEIHAIQDEFVQTGRLTSLSGRGLSGARGNDNAKDVRNTAAGLAEDIQAYIDEAESTDIAGQEREFLSVKTELRHCEDELAIQRDAETLDQHETLATRLDSYREAIENIDEDISRETLEELTDLDRGVSDAETEIERLETQRETLRDEQRTDERELEELEAEVTPLNAREDEIDRLERELEEYRGTHDDAVGATRGMEVAKYVAIGGVGLGGIGAILGSTIAGILLGLIGVIAFGWYWLQHRSVTTAEHQREHVLQLARDAGLEVEMIDDIAPAIQTFRDELTSLRERRDNLDQELSVTERRITDTEEKLREERARRNENREQIQEILSHVTPDTIDEYEEAVSTQEDYLSQRDSAASSLADTFDEPETESPDAKIDYWQDALDALVADVDPAVNADDYDGERLGELEETREQLIERRDELKAALETHRQQIAEFEDRINALSTQPFLDEQLQLESRSIDGLREIEPELERLVARIERDADVAREALAIFDELKAEEEQKITDLFGPGSRATDTFHRITNGRYEAVSYDTNGQILTVQQDGGDVFTADKLSHGTKTQLYLAARVGLGEQLLATQPGFFLMDDAFLPADTNRLREGFDILEELSADGWQIVYFTAKDEIGRDLVDSMDIRCRELDSLE